jgi:hypothetical protein
MTADLDRAPRALPVVARPQPDELLSSWLSRIATDYYISSRQLLKHMGLAAPSVQRLDLTLTLAQAIVVAGFVRLEPTAILAMTHAGVPADCLRLIRLTRPLQVCRRCGIDHKRNETSGAVLKSWMQGWRINCRACGSLLTDVWADGNADSARARPFFEHLDAAREGQEIFEGHLTGTAPRRLSPATALRLLLLRRWPAPHEFILNPRRRFRLLNLLVPAFDQIADDNGLVTTARKTIVVDLAIRTAVLAGVAALMKQPDALLPQLRADVMPKNSFDALVAADPSETAKTFSSKLHM